jgi:hypothetical protein
MKETHKSLTENERNKMKKTIRSNYFTASLIGIMIVFMLHIIYIVGNFKLTILYVEILVIIIFIGIITLTRFLNRNLRNDINGGHKIVREYIIEKKNSYEDNDPGIGGWNTRYYFMTESRKFFVEKNIYEKAEIGDILLEHLAPNSLEGLKIEVRNKIASR